MDLAMNMSINPSNSIVGENPASQTTMLHEREVVRSAGRDAISHFLDSHNCYSVLRASGKVVVFDTRIPIQLAFYALVEHGTFFSCLLKGTKKNTNEHFEKNHPLF